MTSTHKPADQPSDLRTDVLLITVTTVEAQAVLNAFEKETGKAFQRRFIGDKTYFDLGEINSARVLMVQSEMGVNGPGGALLVVDEGIRMLLPTAVIMVGIAFGFADNDLGIGDILISQQLQGYELQKIATDDQGRGETILRDDRPRASVKLLDRFRGGLLDWHGPRVEFGLLLSGSKLIDNRAFRDQLRKLAPEALGGEMEGTGLYSSAYQRKVDWIVVKAISDWADGTKPQNGVDRQKLAAENAVHFTLHVLKQGGFAEEAARGSESASSSSRDSSFAPPSQERRTLPYRYDAHSGWVLAVAWEPGGTRIVSAGADGTARIWEAETGEALLTYRGHTRLLNVMNVQALVYTAAWSPEGLRVASAGTGNNVYVWNATTGETHTIYQGHSGLTANVYAVAWSPDGKQIASACSSVGFDPTVHIWDALTGRLLRRYDARSGWLPNVSILSVTWSSDGAYIAAACGPKTLRIWNAATGDLVSIYRFRSGWVSCLAWSPDNRYLASAHSDRTVQIRDRALNAGITTYHEHTDDVRYVSWSPDGRLIASASNDRTVHIWEALTGRRLYTYRGHSAWVTSVSWSFDGTRIASASNDKTVQIWSAGSTA